MGVVWPPIRAARAGRLWSRQRIWKTTIAFQLKRSKLEHIADLMTTPKLDTTKLALLTALTVMATAGVLTDSRARQTDQAEQIERGKCPVRFGHCGDCHTRLKTGAHGAEPDACRFLSGHPEDAQLHSPPTLPRGPGLR